MERLVTAIGVDSKSGSICQVIYITNPWTGIYKISINDIISNNIEFSNAYINDRGELIGKDKDLKLYTTYIPDENNRVIKTAVFIVVKTMTSTHGRMYYVTNGIKIPTWKTAEEITEYIIGKGAGLANAEMVNSDNGVYFRGANSGIKEVDFIEYMKNIRKEWMKGKH